MGKTAPYAPKGSVWDLLAASCAVVLRLLRRFPVLRFSAALGAVAIAFLCGALYSLQRFERSFPTPLERVVGALAQAEGAVEHLDGGTPEVLRENLQRQIDGLVLVLDALVQGTREPGAREAAELLLAQVARHRDIYGPGSLPSDPEVDRKVGAVLARYRDGPR